jgi:hypothetical protein
MRDWRILRQGTAALRRGCYYFKVACLLSRISSIPCTRRTPRQHCCFLLLLVLPAGGSPQAPVIAALDGCHPAPVVCMDTTS